MKESEEAFADHGAQAEVGDRGSRRSANEYFSKDVMILDRKISEVENELQQEASEEMRKLTVVRRKFETEWQRVSHTTQIVLNGKAVSGASTALRVNLDLKGAENRGARVISGSWNFLHKSRSLNAIQRRHPESHCGLEQSTLFLVPLIVVDLAANVTQVLSYVNLSCPSWLFSWLRNLCHHLLHWLEHRLLGHQLDRLGVLVTRAGDCNKTDTVTVILM